jgi:spore germination protein GerM
MRKRRKPSRAPLLAIVFLAIACAALAAVLWRIHPDYQSLRDRNSRRSGGGSATTGSERQSGRSVTGLVYFRVVTDKALRLIATPRKLPAESPIRAAVEELLAGPVPAGRERPLPGGVRLLDARAADGVATVDFSRELTDNFGGGSENEGVTLYAIVDTLTSLPGVDKVQILVEGERVDTLGGHLDMSVPLSFNGELVIEP